MRLYHKYTMPMVKSLAPLPLALPLLLHHPTAEALYDVMRRADKICPSATTVTWAQRDPAGTAPGKAGSMPSAVKLASVQPPGVCSS